MNLRWRRRVAAIAKNICILHLSKIMDSSVKNKSGEFKRTDLILLHLKLNFQPVTCKL